MEDEVILLCFIVLLLFNSECQAIVYLFGNLLCQLVRITKNCYRKIPDNCWNALSEWNDKCLNRLRLHDCLQPFASTVWIFPLFDKQLNQTNDSRSDGRNCSFVQGQSSNVPKCFQQPEERRIQPNDKTSADIHKAANYSEKSHSAAKLAQTETKGCEERTERPENLGATGGVPINHKETYRLKSSRIETFTGWLKGHIISPKRLANAGLYYTGIEDNVCCFSCDGGLRNWEIGDDPFVMHAQWFPHCKFLQKEKGQDFIEKYRKVQVDDFSDADVFRSTSSESSRLYTIGSNVYTLQGFTEPEHTTDASVVNNGSSSGAKHQQAKQSKLSCKVCNENPRSVLFLPCSHVAVCNRCATDMSKCFVCKTIITDRKIIYVS